MICGDLLKTDLISGSERWKPETSGIIQNWSDMVRYFHIEIVKSVPFWSYQHQLWFFLFFFRVSHFVLLTILDLISDSLAYTVQLLREAYCCFDKILADF